MDQQPSDEMILRPVAAEERAAFARRLQEAFATGVRDVGLPDDDEPIPSDSDIARSFDDEPLQPGERSCF